MGDIEFTLAFEVAECVYGEGAVDFVGLDCVLSVVDHYAWGFGQHNQRIGVEEELYVKKMVVRTWPARLELLKHCQCFETIVCLIPLFLDKFPMQRRQRPVD